MQAYAIVCQKRFCNLYIIRNLRNSYNVTRNFSEVGNNVLLNRDTAFLRC